MPSTNAIEVFAGTAGEAAYLADIVRLAGFEAVTGGRPSDMLLSVPSGKIPREAGIPALQIGGSGEIEGVRVLESPLKAAALIAIIRKTMRLHGDLPAKITIGGCELDTRDNLWTRPGEAPVRLTEKETAILSHLKAADKSVTREELLEHVWSYVREVETHTLETHIYRLRQKIEEDPSVPKILITQGDGYSLVS